MYGAEADVLVIDTHPESSHSLRVDQPFPALEEYARKLDLESMDSMEHSHVPYVVLLVKAAAEWKDAVSLSTGFSGCGVGTDG